MWGLTPIPYIMHSMAVMYPAKYIVETNGHRVALCLKHMQQSGGNIVGNIDDNDTKCAECSIARISD